MVKFTFLYFAIMLVGQAVYDFEVKPSSGETLKLAEFKGKVFMIVNTATKCGFASQLSELEELRSVYENKGLVILAIPTNDFGSQEPLNGEELKRYCSEKHGAKYLVADRMSVSDPLFQFLTQESREKLGSFPERIIWNFEKFIFDRTGNIRFRFRSNQSPISEKVKKAIESLF
ncbi:MAG: glutathione peroxidase [Deltaproteobacteria bacterium]|nr:glutathione peroxidase [Deltaproteobacteria bacterium]